MHQKEYRLHIRTGDNNNRQNTIPEIPAIYITIYQRKEELAELIVGIKGALTQQMKRAHQQDGWDQ